MTYKYGHFTNPATIKPSIFPLSTFCSYKDTSLHHTEQRHKISIIYCFRHKKYMYQKYESNKRLKRTIDPFEHRVTTINKLFHPLFWTDLKQPVRELNGEFHNFQVHIFITKDMQKQEPDDVHFTNLIVFHLLTYTYFHAKLTFNPKKIFTPFYDYLIKCKCKIFDIQNFKMRWI